MIASHSSRLKNLENYINHVEDEVVIIIRIKWQKQRKCMKENNMNIWNVWIIIWMYEWGIIF